MEREKILVLKERRNFLIKKEKTQEMEREKILVLKERRNFLKRKILSQLVTQITQSILVKKKNEAPQTLKKKSILSQKVKKNLKIEVDLNHLNLKNTAKIKLI